VTFTATIVESSANTPTGTITFRDGTATLSTVPVENNQASFTTSALTVGAHNITASYAGDGNFSASQSSVLVQQVNAATLSLSPGNIPSGRVGQPYSATFSAAGGTAPYSFSVASGALPPGLALGSGTGTMSGTPNSAGEFSFSIAVSDASGQTATLAYTLAIAPADIAITITPTTLPAATRGFAVNTTFVASGGTAPYSFALAPGSRLPAGVTLSSAGVFRGVPTEAGTFNFTVQATDSATGTGPYTGTRAFTWTVNGATIAISPVLLPPVLEGRNYGQALAANGGVAPYSFALTAGTLPQGLTLSSAGIISGTPQVAGPVSITVTATDAFGNTGVATISFNVIARPNPALSADIRTTLASEQGLSQRFAWTQLGNFQSRFDTLRSGGSGGGGGGPRGGLRLGSRVADSDVRAVNGSGLLAGGDLFGSAFDGGMGAGGRQDGMVDRFASDYGWNFAPGEREGDMQSGRQQETFSPFGPRDVGTWEFWTGGTLGIGRRDSVNGAARLDFQSEGISAGLDHKLSDRLSLGVGGGLGREHIDIGTDGSTSKGRNGVATVYGTFMPADDLFLDAVVGGGVLDFDVKRYDSNAAVFAEGAREGSMRFASLSFGINRTSDRLAWQAFGRIEHFGAALDAYTETGAGIWNLSYLERSVSSTASALGASAALNGLKIGSALFSPRLRVEWRHAFEDPGTQGIRYADWVDSPVYTVTESDLARDQLAIGLGAGLRLDNDWAVAADISGRFDRDTEAGSMRLEVSKRF
jgi:uncharacterized protein YhjY with autotransporter beta-barrel domain